MIRMRQVYSWLSVISLCVAPVVAADEASKLPPGRDFGAGLTLVETTSLTEIVQAPGRFASQEILLRAQLADVCQKKGCWTLARDGKASVRVRFKDYAFFLPTNSIGAEAYIQGRVEVANLSEREAKHYEAESRNGDPESIRGPVREVSLVASGIRLVTPAQ